MNLLFENLEKLIDAPNGIEKARELILQLAVQGKLVKQDPNDEPASELLKKIKKEKEKLIAEGKIGNQKEFKRNNNDSTALTPHGWISTYLGDLFTFEYGKGIAKTGKENNDKIPVYGANGILRYTTKANIDQKCLIIGRKGSAGKINKVYEPCWASDVTYYVIPSKNLDYDFTYYLLLSVKLEDLAKGIKPGLNRNEAYEIPILLPPLNEQKRIVEKVNSLMALLDELEEKKERRNQKRIKLNNASLEKLLTSKNDKEIKTNWKRIEENFSTLYSVPENVEKLKQTILQLAVQGRIVKQGPNDDPASELLKKIKKEKEKLIAEGKIKKQQELPPIKEEEKPFELPKGWEWVRLGEVTNYGINLKSEGNGLKGNTWVLELEDIEKVTSRIIQKVRYKEKKFKSTKNYFTKGDVIYGKLRPYLDKVIVADEEGVCTTEMIPIRGYYDIDPDYLRLVLKSPYFVEYATNSTHGMNLPRLGTDKARRAVFPLVSLNEQKRIVEKVNELMSLCNTLEEKLTKKEAEAVRLVGAVVNTVKGNV